MGLASHIVSFIITTFLIAALYGFGCATMAFVKGERDPVAIGHDAAAHVHGLFGAVNNEVKSDGAYGLPPSLIQQVAAPYAATADVTALLGGKFVEAVISAFHTIDEKMEDIGKGFKNIP